MIRCLIAANSMELQRYASFLAATVTGLMIIGLFGSGTRCLSKHRQLGHTRDLIRSLSIIGRYDMEHGLMPVQNVTRQLLDV